MMDPATVCQVLKFKSLPDAKVVLSLISQSGGQILSQMNAKGEMQMANNDGTKDNLVQNCLGNGGAVKTMACNIDQSWTTTWGTS